ncbi:hypothetical protein DPEC_G00273240 [Dallia pectoralis]|uniref:Uncharacterized protein n=1 Tax=Dallia pectoralis TaxID=75939 RepID=A0ACC2FPZ6_DALPE|nr:hypothetical protein DPEC_G00273240 [Dallia pectoralis]
MRNRRQTDNGQGEEENVVAGLGEPPVAVRGGWGRRAFPRDQAGTEQPEEPLTSDPHCGEPPGRSPPRPPADTHNETLQALLLKTERPPGAPVIIRRPFRALGWDPSFSHEGMMVWERETLFRD